MRYSVFKISHYFVTILIVTLLSLFVGHTFAQPSNSQFESYVNRLADGMRLIQVPCDSTTNYIFADETYQPSCFIPMRSFDALAIARSFELHFDWQSRTGYETVGVLNWKYENGILSRTFAVRTNPPTSGGIMIDEYVQDVVIWQFDDNNAWVMFD